MTASRLITENKLEQATSGLWHLLGADVQDDFTYSDGDDEESYVKKIIANAADTSSTSAELESHIHDWPSEYHLTTKRAHLLRALDLSGLENVLELGCGCGAISRYLAEQGMNVDAIEGSFRRAGIAHSRCRDLDNINIVNANFNRLKLPRQAYDAVFLIGVLEYARRFCPDAADDRAAVLEILAAVQESLLPDGVVITAIENRLGLKYLMGATEDHYGVPYIGINRYPDSAGICTYDHVEWCSILDDAGYNSNVFLVPFPDYKIPTVVLHEEFLNDPSAASHLRGTVSRDYLRVLDSNFDEYLFWQACVQNGSLLEFANSYLIIAGRDNGTVDKIASFDFAHFTGSQRKAEFRTSTRKHRDEKIVRKQRLGRVVNKNAAASGLQQICIDEDYLTGRVLADDWLQTLMTWQDQQRLITLYQGYYEFLKEYAAKHPVAKDIFDMLPFNIIVDVSGNYHSFDREWQLDEKLTAEFVLFRALFWFVYGNSRQFAPLFDNNGWNSIREYLVSSFEQLGLVLSGKLQAYVAMEDRFQAVIGTVDQDRLVSRLLETVPQAGSGETLFYPRLYWAQPNEHCSEQNSIKATAVLGSDHQQLSFDIPVPLAAGSLLRFDPAEREGYFHLYRLELRAGDKLLLELYSAQEITEHFDVKGISVCGSSNETVFMAHDSDPRLEYRLTDAAENLHVEIEMDWPHSEEYAIVRDGLKQEFSAWQKDKNEMLKQINELKQALKSHKEELLAIKTSPSYRVTRKLTGILKR
ncbi:hypothetical protein BMS3Abin11_02277 [bacterium BMS3Abin11]|nr:hypothetical protein BMS3Abin11_02277 [bacterium BMS3Abin11]GMT41061.1 MAG: hypothetical protein IEMM0001_1796 [bacterium]HDH07980.1 class I SAM-dependent methyltransferase [Gammaproteobacteria bacterium]HDZ78850.1 class I SAM-dependent methyltransferase [Gammaproteobacteria bacterium]